jgi:endonuclease YncB( thermonuclease family)
MFPFAAAAVLLIAPATTPAEHQGRVVGVADGDTLTLLTADKRQIHVRLSCIDAPEKAQAFGKKAKQTLSDLAFGKDATVLERDRDRYGRTVGDVIVAGVNVNKRMVELGLAWIYRQYCRDEAYLELERAARAAKAGLWHDAEPVPPWTFRRSKRGAARAKRDARAQASGPAQASHDQFCAQKRRCSDMATCEEARRALEVCGTTPLDRDGDGVPCESLCGE